MGECRGDIEMRGRRNRRAATLFPARQNMVDTGPVDRNFRGETVSELTLIRPAFEPGFGAERA